MIKCSFLFIFLIFQVFFLTFLAVYFVGCSDLKGESSNNEGVMIIVFSLGPCVKFDHPFQSILQ